METEKSKLRFHEGRVLIELAKSYPSLMDVIYEQVQNALDSNAQMIWISIDYKTKNLVVKDDGDGATKEKFEQALSSVCRSIKDKKDSLGQFGIGLISPLGKCEYFTFTSTPNNKSEYCEWKFITKELLEQEELNGIPVKNRENIAYGLNGKPPYGKTLVPWRTEVAMYKFTKDKTLGRVSLETLREEIVSRFGEKMRVLKSHVHVKITRANKEVEKISFDAPEFSGEKLPVVKYVGKDCGETSFELFLSRKTIGGRKGKVIVHKKFDPFALSAKAFIHSVEGILSVEVPEFLISGVFEGKISTQKCTLLKERNGFEKNDALVEFCEHIERWVKEEGAQHLNQIKDEAKDERYQELGRRSMRTLEEMLERPEFELLKEIVDSGIRVGTIGSNHVDFEKTSKEEKVKSITTKEDPVQSGDASPQKKEESFENGKNNPQSHHENYDHNTTQGPRGQRRRIVRGHSTGLHFQYDEMSGKSVLWEFELKTGILTFNTRHPFWERAEKDDTLLVRFQEFIAISALTIETMNESMRDQHKLYVAGQTGYMLSLMERNMAPGRRKK